MLHVMGSLEVGGRERVVLALARRARAEGLEHRIAVFDAPFRGEEVDLDPGDVPVHFLPRRGGVDLRLAAGLASLAHSLGCHLLHAHNDTPIFYACAAALRLGFRKPAVCGTFHARPTHATLGARLLTRAASARAKRLTAVSADLARFVVEKGWVRRCEVVRNGIDLAEYAPEGPTGGWRERLSISPDAVVIAHIARFAPVKRHVDLLEAARIVERVLPSAVFVIVGQGPLREEIIRLAGSAANLRFVPRVVDVGAFLREVDIFVLCSDHEAMPRVLLEALACARAIVATEVGGVPEMLTDGQGGHGGHGGTCGRLVPRRDPGALANALLELSRNPAARAELGARARLRARDFSSDREWEDYNRVYREALS